MWVVGFSNFFRWLCVTRATGSLTAAPSGNVNVRYTFFSLSLSSAVYTCFPSVCVRPVNSFFSSLERERERRESMIKRNG